MNIRNLFRKPITPDDARSIILAMEEPRRMSILSEMVASATEGKKSIHGKPYSVNPREAKNAPAV